MGLNLGLKAAFIILKYGGAVGEFFAGIAYGFHIWCDIKYKRAVDDVLKRAGVQID